MEDDRLKEFQAQAAQAVPPAPPEAVAAAQAKLSRKERKTLKSHMQQPELQLPKQEQTEDPAQVEERNLKMNEFYEQCQQIETKINLISKLAGDIEKKHKEALGAVTIEDGLKYSREIEMLTGHAASNRAAIKREMDVMHKVTEEVTPMASPGSASLRIRLRRHEQLLHKSMKITQSFQKMEEKAREDYRKQVARQYRIVNPQATDKQVKALLEDTDNAQAQVFAMAVRGEATKELALMQERCKTMKTLEQSVLQLSSLFAMFRDQLRSQQDMLNKINTDITLTEEWTGKAKTATEKAVEQARAIRRRKIIILSILGVAIFLMVIAVVAIMAMRFAPRNVRIMG